MSSSSMILIYFLYGLSFFALGLTITLQNKKFNKFLFSNALPHLAAFGIIHGITEWIDMFILIRKQSLFANTDILDNFKLLFLILSFTFLLSFGLELFPAYSKLVKALKWTIPPLLIAGWLWIYFTHQPNTQIHEIGEIWARYLFGFSGAILSGIGILHNVYKNRKRQKVKVYARYIFLALSFIAYGILAGLIVPEYSKFPASVYNYAKFSDFTNGIPVQLFRAIVAMAMTIFTVESLTINEAEYHMLNYQTIDTQRSQSFTGKIITSADVVTGQEEVIKLGRLLGQIINDAIIIINHNQHIIYANTASEAITGLKKEVILQQNIVGLIKNPTNNNNLVLFKPFSKTLKTGENISDKKVTVNGKEITVTTYLLKSSSPNFKWVVGVFKI